MNIVLFGTPGAGKGTQAERLRERLSLRHISTGDLLRAAVASESDLGQKVKDVLAAGELVSDEIVLALIREAMEEVRSDGSINGWILDGFPRTVTQAEELDKILDETDEGIDFVVVLDVKRETVMQRLLARGRADDTRATIEHRLDVFDEQTKPLIDYYNDRGSVTRIDGAQEIDKVTADIEHLVQ